MSENYKSQTENNFKIGHLVLLVSGFAQFFAPGLKPVFDKNLKLLSLFINSVEYEKNIADRRSLKNVRSQKRRKES